jgi:hypothetical protein
MIEPGNYWVSVIAFLTVYITAITNLLKAIEELMKIVPNVLKPLAKFLFYSITLVAPNIGIIWLFFYLAGSSPERFSEARFFWAMVAQPTLGVSIYAYIWGRWLYPQLQRALRSSQETEAVDVSADKPAKQGQKSLHQPSKKDETSRKRGKKR